MLNLSLTALSINYMTSMSPLIAPTRQIQFNLFSSHISHVISPILYTFPLRHTIRFDNLLFSNALTSAASCKELAPLTESTLYSGCVTASDTTYTSQEGGTYDMTGANFSANNCIFANCSGSSVLFDMTSSLLDFQNSSVQNCALLFIKIDTAVTTSRIYNSTFNDVNGVIEVNSGEMNFDNCRFEKINGPNSFTFDSCSNIIFQYCFFNEGVQKSFIVKETTDFKFNAVQYNCSAQIELDDKSYAMIANSCFYTETPFKSSSSTGVLNTIYDGKVEFGYNCPHLVATQSLTSERKAYAITTVVVFSVGFAALFITLIILVTCKVKEEKVQYGKLHADELPDDNHDPREISD